MHGRRSQTLTSSRNIGERKEFDEACESKALFNYALGNGAELPEATEIETPDPQSKELYNPDNGTEDSDEEGEAGEREPPCKKLRKQEGSSKESDEEPKDAGFFCEWCQVNSPTFASYQSHCSNQDHLRRKVLHQKANPKPPKPDCGKCDICNVTFTSVTVKQQHLEGRKHQNKLKSSQMVEQSSKQTAEEFTCTFCNVTVNSKVTYEAHIKGKSHLHRMQTAELSETLKDDPAAKTLKCTDCDVTLQSLTALQDHYNGKLHSKKRKVAALENSSSQELFCEICNVKSTSVITFEQHNSGKSHSKKLKTIELQKSIDFPGENQEFTCTFCNIKVSSLLTLNAHLTGKNHLKKSGQLVSEEPSEETLTLIEKYKTEKGTYFCNACLISAETAKTFLPHFSSAKHAKKEEMRQSLISLDFLT